MKTDPRRFQTAIAKFPKVAPILKRLDAAEIPYFIGGSVALYAQGNDRQPHDVDIMFTDAAHDAANALFGLALEHIERPNVTMHKSTPVDDGSLDFLSHYRVIADDVAYQLPPAEFVLVEFEGRTIQLVPAEKITVFKLISRRDHHHDLDDVKALMRHKHFDQELFWKVVALLDAKEIVTKLVKDVHTHDEDKRADV